MWGEINSQSTGCWWSCYSCEEGLLPNGQSQHFPTVTGTNREKQLVHVTGAWQSPGLVTAEKMNQWATALHYGYAEVPSIFLLFLHNVYKMQPHTFFHMSLC